MAVPAGPAVLTSLGAVRTVMTRADASGGEGSAADGG